jgi:hypothetical protein
MPLNINPLTDFDFDNQLIVCTLCVYRSGAVSGSGMERALNELVRAVLTRARCYTRQSLVFIVADVAIRGHHSGSSSAQLVPLQSVRGRYFPVSLLD